MGFAVLYFLILCHIIYSDMAYRRISNNSVICIFVLSIVGLAIGSSSFNGLIINSILSSVFVFLLFLVFFLMKMMGAGDVKLVAALAFSLGIESFLMVWVLSVLMVLAYSMFIRFFPDVRWISNINITGNTNLKYKKIVPYGALLGISTMMVMATKVA